MLHELVRNYWGVIRSSHRIFPLTIRCCPPEGVISTVRCRFLKDSINITAEKGNKRQKSRGIRRKLNDSCGISLILHADRFVVVVNGLIETRLKADSHVAVVILIFNHELFRLMQKHISVVINCLLCCMNWYSWGLIRSSHRICTRSHRIYIDIYISYSCKIWLIMKCAITAQSVQTAQSHLGNNRNLSLS